MKKVRSWKVMSSMGVIGSSTCGGGETVRCLVMAWGPPRDRGRDRRRSSECRKKPPPAARPGADSLFDHWLVLGRREANALELGGPAQVDDADDLGIFQTAVGLDLNVVLVLQ